MQLLKKLLGRINGLHYSQDYLCLAMGAFAPVLRAYLVADGRIVRDITGDHLFNGYSPVIFTLSFPGAAQVLGERIEILFTHEPAGTNEILARRVALAGLSLKRIQDRNEPGLFFYEGIHGWHQFVPPFGQWAGRLQNRLYNRRKGNVYLPGNLHAQVQVAYAIPRKISLITVGGAEGYNLFPTDLHGELTGDVYILSLRHGGMACSQVEASGKIVLSDMEAVACKRVFGLGKNHMQPLRDKSTFDFSGAFSKNFNFPLPNGLVAYKELRLVSSFIKGIHKILICKIVYREEIAPPAGTLGHIYNSYATWRYKKKMTGNYILR